MCCPSVCGDNPRALASGLSYVQVDKHGIIFYTTYISVDLALHEIVRAKVYSYIKVGTFRPWPLIMLFQVPFCVIRLIYRCYKTWKLQLSFTAKYLDKFSFLCIPEN